MNFSNLLFSRAWVSSAAFSRAVLCARARSKATGREASSCVYLRLEEIFRRNSETPYRRAMKFLTVRLLCWPPPKL